MVKCWNIIKKSLTRRQVEDLNPALFHLFRFFARIPKGGKHINNDSKLKIKIPLSFWQGLCQKPKSDLFVKLDWNRMGKEKRKLFLT